MVANFTFTFYCIKKTTNYIVYWLFTKKHHARYVCQSVLYNGESRNSNYDDLLWVHGPRVGNWSWQRVGGTSSKNRLESPLVGALTHSLLFHSLCDLKATQMNVQRCQIQESMLSELELGLWFRRASCVTVSI